ncbi:Piso0_000264 [Millerozyma farinosa CBS 7064]|uniref:UDP-N-acetylglucosamine transferase subunit ALG13 n=1 Tax=Pichia sorbitophila (strain ATCC MYA-4447 / BCRC 22081 / CBS 7064 / NBRC 10061 / NRRL Y-12695) TaxID=559304 RepID=G8YTI4_PICSO|nr:Piso0_000264 [Millerozyma farinosa CBS 7064]
MNRDPAQGNKGARILILTGATVTFKSLIKTVVNAKFIEGLRSCGVSTLCLQYGNEIDNRSQTNISKEWFDKCLVQSGLVDNGGFSKTAETNEIVRLESQTANGFALEAFPITPNISDEITKCDLVISHAGTGSIMDVLRLSKPLIVVHNENLMHNHQLEIATAFDSLGVCKQYSVYDLCQDSFQDYLSGVLHGTIVFKTLDKPKRDLFKNIIFQEVSRV